MKKLKRFITWKTPGVAVKTYEAARIEALERVREAGKPGVRVYILEVVEVAEMDPPPVSVKEFLGVA